jgi:hypothetical protein
MLHEQSVRGKPSKLASSEGLRATHEYELGQGIKPFYLLLCNAYHRWVMTNNEIQSRTASSLKSQDDTTAWAPEIIQNLCLACFYAKYDNPEETDSAATVTMDGQEISSISVSRIVHLEYLPLSDVSLPFTVSALVYDSKDESI